MTEDRPSYTRVTSTEMDAPLGWRIGADGNSRMNVTKAEAIADINDLDRTMTGHTRRDDPQLIDWAKRAGHVNPTGWFVDQMARQHPVDRLRDAARAQTLTADTPPDATPDDDRWEPGKPWDGGWDLLEKAKAADEAERRRNTETEHDVIDRMHLSTRRDAETIALVTVQSYLLGNTTDRAIVDEAWRLLDWLRETR